MGEEDMEEVSHIPDIESYSNPDHRDEVGLEIVCDRLELLFDLKLEQGAILSHVMIR